MVYVWQKSYDMKFIAQEKLAYFKVNYNCVSSF